MGIKISKYYINNNSKLLGEGAFGTVYERNDNIKCAVKTIEKDKITKKLNKPWDMIKGMVEKEIENMRKCQSINVVQIYGYDINDNNIEIKMELCQNTLMNYYKTKGTLSLEEIREIFLQLNNALKCLDENNIRHRDLKLENVLIKNENNKKIIKLGDFGLSKYAYENENISTMCGTPIYMAPEILNGNYTSNADIWSIGIMMYILHYGEIPKFKDTYKLEENEKFKEEDDLFLNLLNKIFEEPYKRISWKDYFSDDFFKPENKIISNNYNLNEKKIYKNLCNINEEISCLLILNNYDLCVSAKDRIIIINNDNDYKIKNEIILNKNFIVNHILLLDNDSIGASLDDGNFYIINLFNENYNFKIYKKLEGNKNKVAMTIKLKSQSEMFLVMGCALEIIFWKMNSNNEYEKFKSINYEGELTSLFEYYKKYLIGALSWNESIKIFSLEDFKEIKTFNDIVCSGYHLCSTYLDDKTLLVVGKSFYIFDLEKIELIKIIEYDNYIDSIIKYKNTYLIGVTINEDNEDSFQLHQVTFSESFQKVQKIAYQRIHKGNILYILIINDAIITGSLDKTIKILK